MGRPASMPRQNSVIDAPPYVWDHMSRGILCRFRTNLQEFICVYDGKCHLF